MSLKEKIDNLIENASIISGISKLQLEMYSKSLLNEILSDNACDFIINKLDLEMTNKTNVFIPGGGLSQKDNEDDEKLDFLNQMLFGNWDNFKYVGTNFVIIDPNYTLRSDYSETNFQNINNYVYLKKVIKYIKSHVSRIDAKNITEKFVLANESNIIYEICVEFEEPGNITFYIVGSKFYFSNCVHNLLFDYPKMLETKPDKLTETEKLVYNDNITELKTLYLNKLKKFKDLIIKSNNFFILNCIRFVISASIENSFYSIHENIKKFLLENELTEKVNYLLSRYKKTTHKIGLIIKEITDYNYYYIYPQSNADKVAEEHHNIYDSSLNKEKIWSGSDDPKEYLLITTNVNLVDVFIESKEGGNKYYKKYIKYKSKYLKLKNKL